MKKTYTVQAASNYSETTWTNKRKALQYAHKIADAINPIASVYAGDELIAQYRYTPEMGGRTFRAQI